MEKKEPKWDLLLKIYKILKPNKIRIGIAVVCLIATTLASFLQPLVIKTITDEGLVEKNLTTVIESSLLLLCLVLISQSIETFLAYLFASIHNDAEYQVYMCAFQKMLRLKTTHFTDKNPSEMINSIDGDVTAISSLVDSNSLTLISLIVKIVSSLAGLIIINPLLTMVVLIIIPIKYMVVKKVGDSKQEKIARYIRNYSNFDAWLADTIGGIKEIKLWNVYKGKEEEFRSKKENLLNSQKKFAILDAWNTTAEIVLEWAVSISLYVIGGILLINGQLSLGALFAFLSYSNSVTAPIAAVLNFKMILARVIPSAERLFNFLGLEEEDKGGSEKAEAGDITFENVTFSYQSNRKILDSVNFSIPLGAKVAIIGPNGSGKSTVINLLLKFLSPESGTIKINGKEIVKIDTDKYRELFSVVSQNPYLFSCSLKDNIDLDNINDQDQLAYVYKKSGVISFLCNLPNGENSVVGNNGARLSGGEKQKLAVARALMKNSPYIILDEATSGFDVESDAYLHNVIVNEMQDKTVILVTHRYENLDSMDIIFRLEDGKIYPMPMK